VKLVYQQTCNSNLSRPIYLLCVFRDEHLLLEYFINYYRSLGVTHFILVDNMSDDAGPEYLKSLEHINLWIYRTEGSYSEAAYGTKWVNQLLRKHCSGHYCFTVDVDELFVLDPRNYQTLQQLIDNMESVGANAIPVTLLDMYPEKTNDSYQRGQDFLNHSRYFDDLNEAYYEERGAIYDTFVHKVGGVRKRALGTTVCIHKFPFFKYDFYPLGVAPGYHFFQEDGKVLRQSEKIRINKQPGLLLHFKFIKPGFHEFVEQRIARNEDWDESAEYRAYREALGDGKSALELYDERFSKKFRNVGSLVKFLLGVKQKQ